MSVYTKTGDKGKTGTFSGKRVSKASKLINAIGAIDELNSYLGIVGNMQKIQKTLFTINAILTGAKLSFPTSATYGLEKEMDKMESQLPVQTNFLIYGGATKSSQLYYARALARRAERAFVATFNSQLAAYNKILQYLNRLSDYLFILARFTNFEKKIKEEIWKQ